MVDNLLSRLGVNAQTATTGNRVINSPIDGSRIGAVTLEPASAVAAKVAAAQQAFESWRSVPAPRRGELVRLFGEVLRTHKADLAELVSWEAGKITQEGLGEVQEMIDICDFAVGLSRQLYGLTIASERPGHHMRESWHPLGVVGVISAFNFPVAVWAWNATLALVCGNAVIWKPSEKTPLTALACQALFDKALQAFGGNFDFGLPYGGGTVEHLPLKIGQGHLIPIHQAKGSHPGSGQIEGNGGTQAPYTDQQYAGLFQAQLTGLTHLRQRQMTLVTNLFLRG